ncbi:hypothetical protein [Niveispirillum sp. KHB5.9]|uniref:hypothetical protein n=1 Tax=Niveispirillum sp. KHB5.9 TaxID=3400269 RepID=UPI003A8C0C48
MGFTLTWPITGAFAFGLILGWNVYFVNRYRKGEVTFGDLTTLLGVIAGAGILRLYEERADLFGAYGVGLAVGFFGYFTSLLVLVKRSSNFDPDWFLDGRRKNPPDGYGYGMDTRSTVAPMAFDPTPSPSAPTPNVSIAFHGSNPGEAAMIRTGGPGETHALAAPNPDAARIQRICADVWSQNGPNGPYKDACNYFLIEVAHRLGISLSGTADQITDRLKQDGSGWARLSDGVAARDAARLGKLVVAGILSTDYQPPRRNGHLAVVTGGDMNPAGWAPAGYWGSLDPQIAKDGGRGAPISLCFAADVKQKIIYRCIQI